MPNPKPIDTSSWTFDDRELTAREMGLVIAQGAPSPTWHAVRAELVWRRCTNDAVTLDDVLDLPASQLQQLFMERLNPTLTAALKRSSVIVDQLRALASLDTVKKATN